MRTLFLPVLAATLLAAPFAYADLAVPPASLPETQCETTPADLQGHGYAYTGLYLIVPVDGSVGSCGATGDGHAEYGLGGTIVVAHTSTTLPCRGVVGDHPWYPTITLVDDVLGTDVTFEVFAFAYAEPDGSCGHPDAGPAIRCTHTCTVDFPPSPDGAYYVSPIVATTGRVYAS